MIDVVSTPFAIENYAQVRQRKGRENECDEEDWEAGRVGNRKRSEEGRGRKEHARKKQEAEGKEE